MAKKKVNVELNMTPFIGLFALLVVMLLLTAVWNHIVVLSTDTSAATSSDSPSTKDQKSVSLHVTILFRGLEMSENEKPIHIPHVSGDQIDKMRLVQVLNQWKQRHPQKTDVILNTENSVTYKQLIVVFDTLAGNGWPDVGVNTQ